VPGSLDPLGSDVLTATSYFYLSTTAPRVLLFAGVLRTGSITRCGAVKVLAGVTRAAAAKRFGSEIVYSALLRGDTPRYQVVMCQARQAGLQLAGPNTWQHSRLYCVQAVCKTSVVWLALQRS
jgi:hypothetical protein